MHDEIVDLVFMRFNNNGLSEMNDDCVCKRVHASMKCAQNPEC